MNNFILVCIFMFYFLFFYQLLINHIFHYIKLVTADSRTLNKILELEQKNTSLLREVMRNQSKFETKIEEKLDKISKTVESLKEEKIVVDDGKGKGKHNKSAVFHHVCFGSFI
jgi:peptidoglycan hydrolase CwlO-like protein